MKFIGMGEVRIKFKKEGNYFQKGYFESYNNPDRARHSIPINREKINQLLIEGKLTKQSSDFFEGKLKGLEDVEKEKEVIK